MAITRIGNIASTIPDDSIQNVKFSNIVNFKNIIINGDMSIAQRGTSASNVSTGYDTVDRFKILRGAGQLNVSQETDAPSGSGFVKSFKILEGSTGANPGANDTNRIQQIFEGQNLQYLKKGTSSAESLTLSFWIKATVTGTYIAELFDTNNTRQISQAYTISSANTWEKKTIIFAGDTTGAFTNDNAASLQVNWFLTAGSNYTSGTLQTSWDSLTNANRAVGQVNALASANDFVQITGVQLEAGTTASDFEFLPYDVNLQRCQRYYFKWGVTQNATSGSAYGHGIGSNTNDVSILLISPQIMRTFPSFTSSSLAVQDNVTVTNVTNLDVRESLSSSDRHFYAIHETGSGSIIQYRPYYGTTSASSGYLAGDSEL